MPVKLRLTAVVIACVLALFATACGGSSGGDSTAKPSSSDTPGATSSTGDEAASPLGDLLGLPIADDDAMDAYFNDLSRQAEIKIAECMIGEGFEYNVVDYSQLDGLGQSVDFDTREFAENYGFGIASNPFEESFEAFENFEDPNQKYVENLSQGEQEAYFTALSGEFDFGTESTDFSQPAGCQGDAYNDLFAFGEVFDEFGDEFAAIEEAYNADPRIVSASSGWSSCMAEAGFSYSDVAGAESEIQRRYDQIVRDPNAFAEGGDDDSVIVRTESAGNSEEDVVFGPQTLNPEFQAQVDDLAVDERAIAVASWDCNEPVRAIEEDVRLEYEQQFVDENGAAIAKALAE